MLPHFPIPIFWTTSVFIPIDRKRHVAFLIYQMQLKRLDGTTDIGNSVAVHVSCQGCLPYTRTCIHRAHAGMA